MKVHYTDYYHSSKESNYETLDELEEFHKFKLTEEQEINFSYTNYEVELTMELDTETGKTRIIKVDGRNVE